MSIESSGTDCPECGHRLQVVYVTDREQVVAGWACGECGFAVSEKDGLSSADAGEPTGESGASEAYLLRIEKPLSSDDVREHGGDVESAFRAQADAEMAADERWLLVDPADGTVVDAVAGEDVDAGE